MTGQGERALDGGEGVDVLEGFRSLLGTALRSTVTVAGWYERQTLALLRERMDTVAPSSAAMTARHIDQESLGGKLRGLLERALEDDTSSSRSDLFHHLLDGLVPDEARILGALSDGSASPMIHIFQRTRGGSTGEAVLQNMSLIGKSANLTLPQMTPVYVGRLKLMGLVEEGPEDSRLKTEYEILAADTMVLRAIRRATHGPIPPRVEKRSLQLSPLGADLWRAALDDFR